MTRSNEERQKGNTAPNNQLKRFKINPVELVVLGFTALIFSNSLYHLFYDWKDSKQAHWQAPSHTDTTQPTREPASLHKGSFANIEFDCGLQHQTITTQADKVRITGPLCQNLSGASLSMIKIFKEGTETQAAFTDISGNRFSSSFISLKDLGEHSIVLKFLYDGDLAPLEKKLTLKKQ